MMSTNQAYGQRPISVGVLCERQKQISPRNVSPKRKRGKSLPSLALRANIARVFFLLALAFSSVMIWAITAPAALADGKVEAPQKVKYQITGLFMPDREEDLRTTIANIPQIKLVSTDFDKAEAIVEFIPEKAFPGAKPDQILQRFDNLLRTASNSTFGVKPVRTIPAEKLKWIEIGVVGLDCQACSLAAYESIFKLEGVEQATASFKEGRVRALIDPEKTDRAKVEAALKKKGVQGP